MIYGINWGGPAIPFGIKRMFAQTKRLTCNRCEGDREFREEVPEADGRLLKSQPQRCKDCNGRGKLNFDLKGVAQSPEEKQEMLILATNGSRLIHIQERQTAAGIWYGFYIY